MIDVRQRNISITEPRQLLVEGQDEKLLFGALARHLGKTHIQIHNYEGKDKLRRFLRTLVGTSGFGEQVESVGIVRDADNNSASAFQSIADSAAACGLPRPSGILEPTAGSPKVTVLVVPFGSETGMLEDVCLQSVAGDPKLNCVDDYFNCLEQASSERPRIQAKARAHAYLASREESDLRLGEAAQRGYWPWSSPAFSKLEEILNLL